jgi:hypothetical protein
MTWMAKEITHVLSGVLKVLPMPCTGPPLPPRAPQPEAYKGLHHSRAPKLPSRWGVFGGSGALPPGSNWNP